MLNTYAAKGPPLQRKPLKHRDYEVDLESRLGKTQVSVWFLPYLRCWIWFAGELDAKWAYAKVLTKGPGP